MNLKRILQEMFEDNILSNANQSPPKKKPKINDENNNNDGSISAHHSNRSIYFCNSFVILESDVEEILQNVTDDFFHQCFHFDKVMVRCLLIELHQRTFQHPVPEVSISDLSFDMSVLVALGYLINGNFDLLAHIRSLRNCTPQSLRKAVQNICSVIVNFLSPVYIRFPISQEEQGVNKLEFSHNFGVPGVVGVLDYYHVELENVPGHEEHMYISRVRKRPSVAVQVICDQNYRFLDVNPRFSGSTHNAHIWRRSHIKDILENSQKRNPRTWLIADRGYHLSSCVLNPYRNATDMLQESVNVALKEVQTVALKSFALLKARFRCLNTQLPFYHKIAANIITACVTLHNYLLAKDWPIEANLEYNVPKEENLPNAHKEDAFSPEGQANREFIKEFMFNNSMRMLYRVRRNSNLSVISEI